MAQRCQHRLHAHGKSIKDATRHCLEYLERTAKSCTIAHLFAACIASKRASAVSARYICVLEKCGEKFCAAVGAEKIVATVTIADLDAYLNTLAGMNAFSRNGHCRVLCTLFEYGKTVMKVRAENPAAAAVRVKEIASPVGIVTPDQLGKLLSLLVFLPAFGYAIYSIF